MNKSFTLIEILVVIVVIGIISAFILVGMSSINNSASVARLQAFANSVRNSLLINLVSEWKLNESSGITAYDSWKTNNGTLGGATLPSIQTSGCVSGNCLSFNGTTAYVDCGNKTDYNFSNKFTLSAWAKTSISAGNAWIVSRYTAAGNQRGVGMIRIGQNLGFQTTTDGLVGTVWAYTFSNETITDNVWHHLAVSYDQSKFYLYVDGVKQENSETKNAFDSNTILAIGRQGADDANYFSGSIDEVTIYNAAIPTSQIQQNYLIGLNNLYKNGGFALDEYNQRLVELKNNITKK